MATEEQIQSYWAKAEEELAGAESEHGNHRYNNCAKLTYHACFHAALVVLLKDGVPEPTGERTWSHQFVQAEFSRRFIRRRKDYPAELRDVLPRGFSLRQIADYRADYITEAQATRALRRGRQFLSALAADGGEEQ